MIEILQKRSQTNFYFTAKWIWDSSIFSSIKPKMTSDSLFTFVFFPFLSEFTCFVPKIVLNIKTIFCKKQVHSGKIGENTKVNKQLVAMFWLNWRNYGSVSYPLSCIIPTYVHFTSYILQHFLFIRKYQ